MRRVDQMQEHDDASMAISAKRVRNVCRGALIVSAVLLVAVAIATFFVLGVFAGVVMNHDVSSMSSVGADLPGIMLALLMLVLCVLFFFDLSRGLSPFTRRQARRLRIAAVLTIAYAIFGVITSVTFRAVMQGGFEIGVFTAPHQLFAEINVQLWPFFAAFFLWALSYVFEYGTSLKDLADDTI